jgi:hypothetical protein
VRPAHAALHGRIFRLDSGSPVPPLDYGCRCACRYVAKAGSPASRVIQETTSATPEESVIPAQQAWLDANAKGWRAVAKAASEATPQDRMSEAFKVAKGLGMDRETARMATQASPFPMRAAEPLGIGPNSGVGSAGARLALRWQAGDASAGAELAKKYPATYRRLLQEGWQGGAPPPPAPAPAPAPRPAPAPPAAPAPAPAPPPTVAPPVQAAQQQLETAQAALDRLAAEQAADLGSDPASLTKIYTDMRLAAESAIASGDPAVMRSAAEASARMRGEIDAAIARRAARIAEARRVVEVPAAERTAAAIAVPASRATAEITSGIDAFRSLVGRAALPDARKVAVKANKGRRAFANPLADEVHLGAHSSTKTTVHELGHLLERDPATRAAADAFLKRRTAGEQARMLRDITGQRGYGRSEIAKRDGFIDPYVGKIYPGGLTEVISMGLEYMASDPIAFRAKDPDHFRFIFKLLRGSLEP